MPTATAPRRKRFKRKKLAGFQPVADDYFILDLARKHRLVTADDVHRLLPHRSRQGLGRRFTKLFDQGWLEKSGVQNRDFIKGGGSHSHAGALTDAGYVALAEERDLVLPSPTRWDWNNARLRSTSVPHILATTKFATYAKASALAHADRISIDLSHEILSDLDVAPPRKSKPLSYSVSGVIWQGNTSNRGIEPDELLKIRYADRSVGDNVAPCLVEIDLAKETVDPKSSIDKPTFWSQSSILKKNVIYISDFFKREARPTCGHFGFKTFRVLYVTTTDSHMKEMQECEEKYFSSGPLAIRPGLALYTNWEAIEEHAGDVLGMPWEDRLGRQKYIDGVTRNPA